MQVKRCVIEFYVDVETSRFEKFATEDIPIAIRATDSSGSVDLLGEVRKVQTVRVNEDGEEKLKKKVTMEVSSVGGVALLDVSLKEVSNE